MVWSPSSLARSVNAERTVHRRICRGDVRPEKRNPRAQVGPIRLDQQALASRALHRSEHPARIWHGGSQIKGAAVFACDEVGTSAADSAGPASSQARRSAGGTAHRWPDRAGDICGRDARTPGDVALDGKAFAVALTEPTPGEHIEPLRATAPVLLGGLRRRLRKLVCPDSERAEQSVCHLEFAGREAGCRFTCLAYLGRCRQSQFIVFAQPSGARQPASLIDHPHAVVHPGALRRGARNQHSPRGYARQFRHEPDAVGWRHVLQNIETDDRLEACILERKWSRRVPECGHPGRNRTGERNVDTDETRPWHRAIKAVWATAHVKHALDQLSVLINSQLRLHERVPRQPVEHLQPPIHRCAHAVHRSMLYFKAEVTRAIASAARSSAIGKEIMRAHRSSVTASTAVPAYSAKNGWRWMGGL